MEEVPEVAHDGKDYNYTCGDSGSWSCFLVHFVVHWWVVDVTTDDILDVVEGRMALVKRAS